MKYPLYFIGVYIDLSSYCY